MSQDPEMPTVVVYVRGGLVQDVSIDGQARCVILDFDGDNQDDQPLRYIHPNLDGTGGDTERCDGWVELGPTGPGKGDPYVRAALAAIATRNEVPADPALEAWLEERQPRPHKESPEVTGNWQCPYCTNKTHFIGYDYNGYGGPSDCECGAYDENGDAVGGECSCSTTLRQPLTVLRGATETGEDGEIIYAAFTGGGSGAEIGSYDSIECAECGGIVWNEVPPGDDPATTEETLPAGTDWPADQAHRMAEAMGVKR